MAYNLPVNFVKVSVGRSDNKQADVAICITRIVAIMSTKIYQARKTLAAERRAGTLINAAGIDKVETAIFLDNGSVVASPLSVTRILTAIEKANSKANARLGDNIKVFDVSPFENYNDEEDDFDDDDD